MAQAVPMPFEGGALTQDSSGSIRATQIGSPEVPVTEMRGQSSSLGRFDSRIDAASLATLAELGLSEVQIARYRRRWCRRQPSTEADAALRQPPQFFASVTVSPVAKT
jgi:hypothetical protein